MFNRKILTALSSILLAASMTGCANSDSLENSSSASVPHQSQAASQNKENNSLK